MSPNHQNSTHLLGPGVVIVHEFEPDPLLFTGKVQYEVSRFIAGERKNTHRKAGTRWEAGGGGEKKSDRTEQRGKEDVTSTKH